MDKELVKKAESGVDGFEKDSSTWLDKYVKRSIEFSTYSPPILAGIFGALCGSLLSFILSHFLSLNFWALEAFLAPLGLTLGIFFAKGGFSWLKRYQSVDLQKVDLDVLKGGVEAHKVLQMHILEQIKLAEAQNAPKESIDILWKQYDKFNSSEHLVLPSVSQKPESSKVVLISPPTPDNKYTQ